MTQVSRQMNIYEYNKLEEILDQRRFKYNKNLEIVEYNKNLDDFAYQCIFSLN